AAVASRGLKRLLVVLARRTGAPGGSAAYDARNRATATSWRWPSTRATCTLMRSTVGQVRLRARHSELVKTPAEGEASPRVTEVDDHVAPGEVPQHATAPGGQLCGVGQAYDRFQTARTRRVRHRHADLHRTQGEGRQVHRRSRVRPSVGVADRSTLGCPDPRPRGP